MDFYELEAFSVLARTLHFAKAAAAVHSSPSALSRLLGRLEVETGVHLLERDTRRVKLTEEGMAFLSFADDSLRKRNALQSEFASRDGKLRGSLRVYASVTACYSVLAPFAEALHAEYPELSLSVETGDPADAETAIRDERADIAVAALPESGFDGLDCFWVQSTTLVFAASAAGPYGRLDIADTGYDSLSGVLSRVPLILPRSGLARDRYEKWAKKRRLKPRASADCAGNEAALALARLGLGLALVPRIVLENSPFSEGLVIYDAGEDFGGYDIGYAMRKVRLSAASESRSRNAVASLLDRVYPGGVWIRA